MTRLQHQPLTAAGFPVCGPIPEPEAPAGGTRAFSRRISGLVRRREPGGDAVRAERRSLHGPGAAHSGTAGGTGAHTAHLLGVPERATCDGAVEDQGPSWGFASS